MERSIAVKKLRAMLGKEFGYRINPKAPSREEREEAKAAMPAAFAEKERLLKLREARYRELLQDPEYQRLKSEHAGAHKKWGLMSSAQHSYKISVGKVIGGLLFSVKAEGDSWEEIFAKLKHSRPAPVAE